MTNKFKLMNYFSNMFFLSESGWILKDKMIDFVFFFPGAKPHFLVAFWRQLKCSIPTLTLITSILHFDGRNPAPVDQVIYNLHQFTPQKSNIDLPKMAIFFWSTPFFQGSSFEYPAVSFRGCTGYFHPFWSRWWFFRWISESQVRSWRNRCLGPPLRCCRGRWNDMMAWGVTLKIEKTPPTVDACNSILYKQVHSITFKYSVS